MTTDNGISAYASLGADINKNKTDSGQSEVSQGVVSEKLPELELSMSNEDIAKLIEKWEKDWKESTKKAEWEKQIEENEKYWLGLHFDTPKADKGRALVDNVIFEALETYLPQATRRNPEPLVQLDPTEESTPTAEEYLLKLKKRLADLGDKNKLRLKLKKGARHWAIYQLGVGKFGWDLDKNMPVVRIVRPKRIILDPDATIDEDGYTGNRVGEYRKMEASKILAIIANEKDSAEAKKAITELVKDDVDTEINFIEWWTPQYLCWKLGKTVLFKKKNPHWNYDTSATTEAVDDYGNATPSTEEKPGINHFPSPKMPYEFLSVFNLGDQPMDRTSLIQQNLSNQDKINKRNKQIDKNADRMNGGMVVSLGRSGLTQSQAKGVSEALRKGGVVVIPDGAPREAIDQYSPTGLPNDVYNDLNDTRMRSRDIFGVSGSTPSGIREESTVRGKIMSRSMDTDRIGGGVTEYLEQFADNIYNWFVQLLYVYDDGFQFVGDAVPPKVSISVKEGSLLPKDSTTIANQAIELGTRGKMALIDMYKRLEYPNAEELAANVWLETNAPQLLYKDNPLIAQAMQMAQEAAAAKAEADAQGAIQKHEQNIEAVTAKENAKAQAKGGGAERSLLSEVPQESTGLPTGP